MIFEEDEIDVPIYLITGFLESGKTTFINFTVSQDYFQIPEPTLLITTEEGEVEYNAKELLRYNTLLEVVESEEDFTPDYLRKLYRKYRPERVILEYNPLWSVKKLEDMLDQMYQESAGGKGRGALRRDPVWGIVQEIVTVDASTFQIYMQNMKSLFMEMARNADMVMFNRARKDDPLAMFRRSIKVANPACEVLFEDENGELANIFEDEPPYDLNADVVEIDDADYGIFYVDMGDHPERYRGKTVRFRGKVMKSRRPNANFFTPVRPAMTCCAEDISYIGYVCKCASARDLTHGQWVEVTATVGWEYSQLYRDEGPVLTAKSIRPAKAPETEMVYFN